MIDDRRLRPTVSLIVAHNEILPDRPDASGKSDLLFGDPLKVVAVFDPCDLLDILLRGVEENQNRRGPGLGSQWVINGNKTDSVRSTLR